MFVRLFCTEFTRSVTGDGRGKKHDRGGAGAEVKRRRSDEPVIIFFDGKDGVGDYFWRQ